MGEGNCIELCSKYTKLTNRNIVVTEYIWAEGVSGDAATSGGDDEASRLPEPWGPGGGERRASCEYHDSESGAICGIYRPRAYQFLPDPSV